MFIKTSERAPVSDTVGRKGTDGGSVLPPASTLAPLARQDLVTLSSAARLQAAALSRDLVRLLAAEPERDERDAHGRSRPDAQRLPASATERALAAVRVVLEGEETSPLDVGDLPRALGAAVSPGVASEQTTPLQTKVPASGLAPPSLQTVEQTALAVEEVPAIALTPGATPTRPASAPLALESAQGTAVARSATGWATLLQRLFRAADPYAGARRSFAPVFADPRRPAFDALPPVDRALIADVYDLAGARGVSFDEVDALAHALGRFRLGMREEVAPDADVLALGPGLRLAIPAPEEGVEHAARSILSLLALRDTRIDHDFVATVLHPSRLAAQRVDLGLLRQVVQAFSPRYASGLRDPNVSFAARDQVLTLARDVRALATGLRATLAHEIAPHDVSLPVVRAPSDEAPSDQDVAAAQGRSHALREALLAALPSDDRAVVSQLYAHADAGRVEAHEVDRLARDLSVLRQHEAALLPNGAPLAHAQGVVLEVASELAQREHVDERGALPLQDEPLDAGGLVEGGSTTSAMLAGARVQAFDARARRRSRRALRRWALRIQRKRRSSLGSCATSSRRRSR